VAEFCYLWSQAVGRLGLVVLPVFAYLLFFSVPLVTLYATEKYPGARWVFRVFLLALPLRCAVYNPLLVGMGKARWALWGSLGDLLVNAALSVALVQLLLGRGSEWAFLGAAVATVIATYLQVGFLVGSIAWHLGWRLAQLLPWGRLVRIAAISAAAAAAAWLAASWGAAPLAKLASGTPVFCVTLVALLLASPQERGDIMGMAKAMRRPDYGSD
jgi:O-antigen/teichoic acid export membrane protein